MHRGISCPNHKEFKIVNPTTPEEWKDLVSRVRKSMFTVEDRPVVDTLFRNYDGEITEEFYDIVEVAEIVGEVFQSGKHVSTAGQEDTLAQVYYLSTESYFHEVELASIVVPKGIGFYSSCSGQPIGIEIVLKKEYGSDVQNALHIPFNDPHLLRAFTGTDSTPYARVGMVPIQYHGAEMPRFGEPILYKTLDNFKAGLKKAFYTGACFPFDID